jgi:protein required for attachment to host cells
LREFWPSFSTKGRTLHAFGKLVLVAEPRFLGMLRAALDPHTAALVVKTVHKDLPGVSEKDLASHLE